MFLPGLGVPKYFKVQRAAFEGLGIDITSFIYFFQKPWKLIVPTVALLSLIICSGYFVCAHAGEMHQSLRAFSQFLICGLIFVRFLIFICKREVMVKVVRKIWLMSMKATKNEMRALTEENAKDVLLNTIFQWSCLATLTACFTTYLLITAYTYWCTGELQFYLPILGSFPLDLTRPLNYMVVYLWSLLGSCGAALAMLCVDTYYLWCLHNLIAQFRILQIKLKDEILTSSSDGKQIELVLKRCIFFHQQITSTVKDFQSAFRSILFVQFAMNATQFCVTAYLLLHVTSLVQLPFLIFFLLSVLAELMVFCYGGQQLQNASQDAAWAIYDAIEWNNWPVRCKKLVLLWLLRAQRPCKLNGIFFEVDYSLFLWVCQTAFSYMTLLKSLDNN